jgi:hypothetical protein
MLENSKILRLLFSYTWLFSTFSPVRTFQPSLGNFCRYLRLYAQVQTSISNGERNWKRRRKGQVRLYVAIHAASPLGVQERREPRLYPIIKIRGSVAFGETPVTDPCCNSTPSYSLLLLPLLFLLTLPVFLPFRSLFLRFSSSLSHFILSRTTLFEQIDPSDMFQFFSIIIFHLHNLYALFCTFSCNY